MMMIGERYGPARVMKTGWDRGKDDDFETAADLINSNLKNNKIFEQTTGVRRVDVRELLAIETDASMH